MGRTVGDLAVFIKHFEEVGLDGGVIDKFADVFFEGWSVIMSFGEAALQDVGYVLLIGGWELVWWVGWGFG